MIVKLGSPFSSPLLRVALVFEGGHDHEPDDGHSHEAADERAEAKRGALEEAVPREPLTWGRRRHRGLALTGRRHFGPLGLDRLGLDPVLLGRVTRPEEAEDDRDRRSDRRDDLRIDDQADEDARDAGGESDRVERRSG
jgi:hypothetical protein